eukprot:6235087-Prymnesium_polylepis.1
MLLPTHTTKVHEGTKLEKDALLSFACLHSPAPLQLPHRQTHGAVTRHRTIQGRQAALARAPCSSVRNEKTQGAHAFHRRDSRARLREVQAPFARQPQRRASLDILPTLASISGARELQVTAATVATFDSRGDRPRVVAENGEERAAARGDGHLAHGQTVRASHLAPRQR